MAGIVYSSLVSAGIRALYQPSYSSLFLLVAKGYTFVDNKRVTKVVYWKKKGD